MWNYFSRLFYLKSNIIYDMKEVVENNTERQLYAPLGEVNHCVLYAAEKLLLYVSCTPIEYRCYWLPNITKGFSVIMLFFIWLVFFMQCLTNTLSLFTDDWSEAQFLFRCFFALAIQLHQPTSCWKMNSIYRQLSVITVSL